MIFSYLNQIPFINNFSLEFFPQQRYVISALANMANQTNDEESIEHVITYLEVCHALFEKGLLSHMKIKYSNSLAIRNVKKGFKYFEDWCRAHENAGNKVFTFIARL